MRGPVTRRIVRARRRLGQRGRRPAGVDPRPRSTPVSVRPDASGCEATSGPAARCRCGAAHRRRAGVDQVGAEVGHHGPSLRSRDGAASRRHSSAARRVAPVSARGRRSVAEAGRRPTGPTGGNDCDSVGPLCSIPRYCSPIPPRWMRFDEHEVVLPVVVITELEAKRSHPELGYFARSALRMLDDLRVAHGRLDEPLPIGDRGGVVRVELNHTDPAVLPPGFRLGDNDSRILAVARNLAAEGRDVTLGVQRTCRCASRRRRWG